MNKSHLVTATGAKAPMPPGATYLLSAILVIWTAGSALAGSICPAGNGASPFPYNPDNAATGCNNVITINSDGSVTAAVMDPTPYEDSEDILVGVVNNGPTPLSFLWLTGGSQGLFGFDGDGMCFFTFVGDSYCAGKQADPLDYEGPTSSFSNLAANQESGTVNFSPAVAPGGTTYFSLEDGLAGTCNITVLTISDIIFRDGFEYC